MHDDLLDESLFDEKFNESAECNCECGCTVPVQGLCVDCSEDSGHQNHYKLPQYDHLNQQFLKQIGDN